MLPGTLQVQAGVSLGVSRLVLVVHRRAHGKPRIQASYTFVPLKLYGGQTSECWQSSSSLRRKDECW